MRDFRELRRDEEGTFLVFVGIALAVLLGMVALSFDLGRVAATQTELQSFADNVALAAAGELDGSTNSIARARAAAAALIQDSQTFGSDDADDDANDQELDGSDVTTGGDVTLTFLSALDADDTPPYADTVTTNPLEAAYVRVEVTPHNVRMAFASVLSVLTGGREIEGEVRASAAAGFTQFACDITPLMVCQPDGGMQPGLMVRLHAGGNGQWVPGNFGYLDVSSQFIDPEGPCGDLNGQANITRCLLGAVDRITQCHSLRGVNTDTGQRVGITQDAYNFRFDRFANSARSERGSDDFAPAPNTIQGWRPRVNNRGEIQSCNLEPATDSMGLPHGSQFDNDPNLKFGSTGTFAPRTAARTAYVNMNYGGVDPFPTALTRWAYYNAEITAGGGPSSTTRLLGAPRLETGRRQCSTHQDPNPERRVVVMSGIDCIANNVQGATSNIPVEAFYRLFLTEPFSDPGSGGLMMYGEVIDVIAGSGSTPNGLFHDVVQLYR